METARLEVAPEQIDDVCIEAMSVTGGFSPLPLQYE
jgi:hypothetical protein